MIEGEPSPAKLELIRKFLRLSGKQAEIDRGSFLDRLGAPRPSFVGPNQDSPALRGSRASSTVKAWTRLRRIRRRPSAVVASRCIAAAGTLVSSGSRAATFISFSKAG